jgi:soluble lytic murein transglycosylase
MMKYLFTVLFVISFSFSQDFEKCYELFKKENFFQAKKCFLSIKDKNLKPYVNYFVSEINLIYDEKPVLPHNQSYAVDSYIYLKLAADNFYKKDYKNAKNYLSKVEKDALDEDDIPFYLYLKANLYNDFNLEKILATDYIYDRFYGYKTFLKIYKKLSNEEIQKAIDKLISCRMYQRALGILPLLKPSDKVSYYYLYLNVKTNNIQQAKNYLNKMDKKSKWYAAGLYILGYYSKNWEERKYYFDKLVETENKKYIQELADLLMKKAFHYQKNDYFLYFVNYLPENEDKVWYLFLYKYFYEDKTASYKFLLKNKEKIKNKNKLNYWLFLSSKKKMYLNKVKNSAAVDFYKVISTKNIKFKPKVIKLQKNKLIDTLKKNGDLYKWAYLEAEFIYKKTKNVKVLKEVMPEVVVSELPYKERFIKPFENLKPLTYAVMKQESLFYYKAISVSNAVGLMQFIPSTAYWAAKKRNDKDFDIVDMFNPYVSIDYGRWYLNYLLKEFKGNIFYTISAYNGGVTNVKNTIKRFKPQNIAEFIETHPFDETRNYLKKVYTNYIIYKKLEDKKVVYRAD